MGRSRVRLLSALIACLAIALMVSSFAFAQDVGVYEHAWQAQTMVGGEMGGEWRLRVDEATLSLDEVATGDWEGSVTYQDHLGVLDALNRVRAYLSEFDLALEGVTIEPDSSAGGTFSGTVRIQEYEAASISDDELGEMLSDVIWDVTGHWGAIFGDGRLDGEILYETAVVQGERMDDARVEASRFNRLSTMSPDVLGEAQTFSVDPYGDAGDDANDDAEADAPSVIDHILKGLSGPEEDEPMYVPAELMAAARDLRDAEPAGATPLPDGSVSVDLDLSGAYLDAKNRAAGLLDDEGPTSAVQDHAPVWQTAREATVRPVAPADKDRVRYYGERLLASLASQEGVPGAQALITDIQLLFAGPASGTDPGSIVKLWSEVVQATAPGPASGDVLLMTRETVEVVLDELVPVAGPSADAILVAADSGIAPVRARSLTFYEADPLLDASAASQGDGVVTRTLGRHASDTEPPALSWMSTTGAQAVAPASWPAFVSPVGRVLWRAGEDGPSALTDGALRGWAFTIERSWLVDVERTGRILAVFDLE